MKITERRLRSIIRSVIKENTSSMPNDIESSTDQEDALQALEDFDKAFDFAVTNEAYNLKSQSLESLLLSEGLINNQIKKAINFIDSRLKVSKLSEKTKSMMLELTRTRSKEEKLEIAEKLAFALGFSTAIAPLLVWLLTAIGVIDLETYANICGTTGGILGQGLMFAVGTGIMISTDPEAPGSKGMDRAYQMSQAQRKRRGRNLR